jgi:endo-1,4-beta-xylanase
MNRLHKIQLVFGLVIITCLSFEGTPIVVKPAARLSIDSSKGLQFYFKKYFTMGVAVSPRSLHTDEAGLILRQFGSLTAENAMKMGPIHPKENEYYWKDADSIVAFAKRNHLKIRGHNLCWHNQTPRWLFTDEKGDTVSKTVLLQRLKDHIETVVKRYKGSIYAWDVVNEAISDKPGEMYRNSPWYRICGDDFIAKAFEYAHEADPKALLFYNDYNVINPVKREKIYQMIQEFIKKGVPIQGIGIQGHWATNEPSAGLLDSTLQTFTKLGLQIQVTELDISVYPKEHQSREKRKEDFTTDFSAEKEAAQIDRYKTIFRIFEKYKKQISVITFWNISDRYSWLDNFPVRGRKDYPLLFDKNLQPKKAYWEVIQTLDEKHSK